MTKPRKITPAEIGRKSIEIRARLTAAETANEIAQRNALFADGDEKEQAQADADAAYDKLQKAQRELEALLAAAAEIDREADRDAIEAKREARSELAAKARPLADNWLKAAQALSDHLDAIPALIEAVEEAREQVAASPPFVRTEPAELDNDEWGRFRGLSIGGQRTLRSIAYRLFGDGRQLFPEVNYFSIGERVSLGDGIARQHEDFVTFLDGLAGETAD